MNLLDSFRTAELLPHLLVSRRFPVQQEVEVVHVEVDNSYDCNQTSRCCKNPREDSVLGAVGTELLGRPAEDGCEEQ